MILYDNHTLDELLRLVDQGDIEAEYQVAMRYCANADWQSANNWLNKVIANKNHPRRVASISYLAQLYAANGSPYTNKKEAIRLFESIMDVPTAVIARLNLGFLYCEENRVHEGLNLIEGAVKQLIQEDGNDEYLKQIECYKIGVAYEGAQCFDLAIDYYRKAIARSDRQYESDRMLIEKAQEGIADCESRKSMGLEDKGNNN